MIVHVKSIYSFQQLGNRENQEDSRYPDSDSPSIGESAFIVCDGIGGCDDGHLASSTVCNCIGELLSLHKNTDNFPEEDFSNILKQAYKALDDVSLKFNTNLGTTLSFVAIHRGGIFTAHLGDSRIYQIRPGEGITYRSEDHSLVNALLRSGNISPDEISGHPKRNIIIRSMFSKSGTSDKDNPTVLNIKNIVPGDYILLCSDGVIDKITDEDLIALYSSSLSDENKLKQLSKICKESSDNNTAIQICIGVIDNEEEDSMLEESLEEEEDLCVNTEQITTDDEDSVHELPLTIENNQSKIRTIFSRLFQ